MYSVAPEKIQEKKEEKKIHREKMVCMKFKKVG